MTTPATASPLTPLDDALALWLDGVRPVAPRRVAVAEAAGAVLAEAVIAAGDVPARSVARRAGFAVAAAQTVGASPYAPAPCLEPLARVEAGDPLPPGCDAVLPADAVSDGPVPEILAEVPPGTDVRRAGEDVAAGTVVFPAGHRLRGSDVALLAALGVETVAIRRPRVRLEGVAQLAALVRAHGAEPAEHDVDLVLARGGIPARCRVDGLALRPGETTRLGRTADGVPVAGLPVRDADALAAALVLLPPALAVLAGAPPVSGRAMRLTCALTSTVGLTEIALLVRDGDGVAPLAVGDAALAAFARADGFSLVPPRAEGYATGETIEVETLP